MTAVRSALIRGNALHIPLADNSVHCVVTSPPYWAMRSYVGTATWLGGDPLCDHSPGGEARVSGSTLSGGKATTGHKQEPYRDACRKCGAQRVDQQLGLEPLHDCLAWARGEPPCGACYVCNMRAVFAEVRRVLRPDGSLWLNLGDGYSNIGKNGGHSYGKNYTSAAGGYQAVRNMSKEPTGLKPKDMVGVPWRVALALQAPYREPDCIKSEADRAWMAAMFDGEGCIGIRRFRSYREEKQQVYQDGFVIYTIVANNDLPILERCIEITGYGKIALKSAAGSTDNRQIVSRRDSYGWRLDGNKAVDVVRAIYPYLVAKRKQACIAYTLDKLNKTGHGSGPVPSEIQDKKAYLKDLIHRCNQREAVDLPSWIEEPGPEIQPGWYLRSDIIWSKPNPMPESVTDRPTKAHEYIFLLAKSERYYYDAEAVKEAAQVWAGQAATFERESGKATELVAPRQAHPSHRPNRKQSEWTFGQDKRKQRVLATGGQISGGTREAVSHGTTRNRRTVWTIATSPFSGAHFATYPPALVEPCIKAGSRPGDIVFDPFNGSGTSGLVAQQLGRRYVGMDLSPDYLQIARERLGLTALEQWQAGDQRAAAPADLSGLPLFGGDS